MQKQKSFSKIEQEVRRDYRNSLNIADSTEDVKKFFVYTARNLFEQVFDGRINIDFEDIQLDNNAKGGLIYSSSLLANKEFRQTLKNSDLKRILSKLAEKALNRIKHLEEKQPDKSEAKIFQPHAQSGRTFKNRVLR